MTRLSLEYENTLSLPCHMQLRTQPMRKSPGMRCTKSGGCAPRNFPEGDRCRNHRNGEQRDTPFDRGSGPRVETPPGKRGLRPRSGWLRTPKAPGRKWRPSERALETLERRDAERIRGTASETGFDRGHVRRIPSLTKNEASTGRTRILQGRPRCEPARRERSAASIHASIEILLEAETASCTSRAGSPSSQARLAAGWRAAAPPARCEGEVV